MFCGDLNDVFLFSQIFKLNFNQVLYKVLDEILVSIDSNNFKDSFQKNDVLFKGSRQKIRYFFLNYFKYILIA